MNLFEIAKILIRMIFAGIFLILTAALTLLSVAGIFRALYLISLEIIGWLQ